MSVELFAGKKATSLLLNQLLAHLNYIIDNIISPLIRLLLCKTFYNYPVHQVSLSLYDLYGF